MVLADVDELHLDEHVARLRQGGGPCAGVAVDVRGPDAVDRLGQAAVDHFGALHVAVNNAGIVDGGNSWEPSLEEWHRVLDFNLWGVIHGVSSFVPRILASVRRSRRQRRPDGGSVTRARLGSYTWPRRCPGLSDVSARQLPPSMRRSA